MADRASGTAHMSRFLVEIQCSTEPGGSKGTARPGIHPGGLAGCRSLRRMLAYAAQFVEDPRHRGLLQQVHPMSRITYPTYDWSINK